MLSAQSFGELVARYKYLHEIAMRDRALLHRVDDLRNTIRTRRSHLVSLQGDVRENRFQKEQEEERLRALEARQQKNLARVEADTKQASRRIRELAHAETRLNGLIASFEAERRRAALRNRANRPGGAAPSAAQSASTVRTSDYGHLAWPVDGNILYRFGRVINPNNTVTRWNGMGIAAACWYASQGGRERNGARGRDGEHVWADGHRRARRW